MLHASRPYQQSQRSIMIHANDTDVLVLAITKHVNVQGLKYG